eukprot:TRINITY_DN2759_c0_g1_i1.p1 TRINITY_DN2759_c0_g1~~TRINITY_DN2759_c0_g1_i1.p1  ORF type:complete len:193 (+),score=33.23 TRINITY_DN2759_c0_g1_i1:30-608(+)
MDSSSFLSSSSTNSNSSSAIVSIKEQKVFVTSQKHNKNDVQAIINKMEKMGVEETIQISGTNIFIEKELLDYSKPIKVKLTQTGNGPKAMQDRDQRFAKVTAKLNEFPQQIRIFLEAKKHEYRYLRGLYDALKKATTDDYEREDDKEASLSIIDELEEKKQIFEESIKLLKKNPKMARNKQDDIIKIATKKT